MFLTSNANLLVPLKAKGLGLEEEISDYDV
jgi:hypothetical protein